MKEEYKARAKFVRDAGSAMVALVGVNDQLDFTDIKKIGKLMELSKEADYFNRKVIEYKGKLECLNEEEDKDKIYDLKDEISWCTSCAVNWEIDFINEMQSLEQKYPDGKFLSGAIWELEMLAKISLATANHLKANKLAYELRNAEISE